MKVELTALHSEETSVSIMSTAAGAVMNATSYQMNDIHTTVADVLA